jgi:hypothetical protein
MGKYSPWVNLYFELLDGARVPARAPRHRPTRVRAVPQGTSYVDISATFFTTGSAFDPTPNGLPV